MCTNCLKIAKLTSSNRVQYWKAKKEKEPIAFIPMNWGIDETLQT